MISFLTALIVNSTALNATTIQIHDPSPLWGMVACAVAMVAIVFANKYLDKREQEKR